MEIESFEILLNFHKIKIIIFITQKKSVVLILHWWCHLVTRVLETPFILFITLFEQLNLSIKICLPKCWPIVTWNNSKYPLGGSLLSDDSYSAGYPHTDVNSDYPSVWYPHREKKWPTRCNWITLIIYQFTKIKTSTIQTLLKPVFF